MASIDQLRASDGTGNASVATVQSTRAPGASTIVVDTVANINTNFIGSMGTPHTFIDPVTSEEITVISEETAVDFKGHVDGSNLEIDTIAAGYTDAGSAVGDIVIIKPTTQWGDAVAEVLEVAHNDDGTPKDDSIDSMLIFSSLVRDNIVGAQGHLINGKIVTSVASNNLTVAIKGLDGNNPSATNPVYVRIGDTVRSITAALSVTKNAGTNWFGKGASYFATNESDFFAYLGYNATDGVVLGFSSIPNARVYSDFSVTTTAWNYGAISTVTNAAATDEYENIGRFNATLSATASFNWSIPATSIIINRPIFETRIFSATNTASGGGTIYWQQVGPKKRVWGETAIFTVSGAAPSVAVKVVGLPVGFLTTVQTRSATSLGGFISTQYLYANIANSQSTSQLDVELISTNGADGQGRVGYLVEGI